ncbi:MAG: hypothetical protein SWH61_15090 [Thermodesulfobacteriota bacterium]|nr:hypothetical protein [Thermodesulfobacteriota bacterium]
MDEIVAAIQEAHKNLLPGYLGMKLKLASKEEVVGTLEWGVLREVQKLRRM